MQQGSNDRSLVDSKKIISSKLQSFPDFNQIVFRLYGDISETGNHIGTSGKGF